jgi:hypothetical protein
LFFEAASDEFSDAAPEVLESSGSSDEFGRKPKPSAIIGSSHLPHSILKIVPKGDVADYLLQPRSAQVYSHPITFGYGASHLIDPC